MDFLLALNVTIYGLGIVFLALLILMFSIMVLSKLFSIATGKEVFSVAPAAQTQTTAAVQLAGTGVAVDVSAAPDKKEVAEPAAAEAATATMAEVVEQVVAPLPGKLLSVAVKVGDKVKPGDELCVIEAMKMGNSIKAQREGIVGEVLAMPGESVAFGSPLMTIVREGAVSPAQKTAKSTAAAVSTATKAAQSHTDAATAVATGPADAAIAGFNMGVSGARHRVELKTAPDGSRLVVIDGTPCRIELDEKDSKKVVVNGEVHTIEIKDQSAGSAFVIVDGIAQKVEIADRVYKTPSKSFKLAVNGRQYQVEVDDSVVKVDGSIYQIERDAADGQRILINGQPHVAEVKEIVGESAVVDVDGKTEVVKVLGLQAGPAAPAPKVAVTKPTPAPAVPAAPVPTPTPTTQPPADKRPTQGDTVTAPIPGKIISVAVKIGDAVKPGDELCVIEAMKMGNSIKAQRGGTIVDVLIAPGQSVGFGAPLVVIG